MAGFIDYTAILPKLWPIALGTDEGVRPCTGKICTGPSNMDGSSLWYSRVGAGRRVGTAGRTGGGNPGVPFIWGQLLAHRLLRGDSWRTVY